MFVFRLILRVLSVALPRARGMFFRLLGGLYFRRVGPKTSFYGWPAFGTYHGNIGIGRSCLIGRGVFFSASRGCAVDIGDECSVNTGCHIVALYGIRIGDGTRIGEFCSIRDQNHQFDVVNGGVSQQEFSGRAIEIGRDCWIGRGVFIGPGVTVGDGAIIGANAVVIKDVPSRCVAVGIPARPIRFFGSSVDA